MINFRSIFNPSYNYLGIVTIIIIILLIIWTNQNFKKSLQQIGSTSLTASLIILIFSLLIKFILNNLIPYQYKLFLEVISENLFQSILMLSVIGIIIGILLVAISKYFFNNETKKINS